jgi:hypothetical protein
MVEDSEPADDLRRALVFISHARCRELVFGGSHMLMKESGEDMFRLNGEKGDSWLPVDERRGASSAMARRTVWMPGRVGARAVVLSLCFLGADQVALKVRWDEPCAGCSPNVSVGRYGTG